MPVKAWEGRRVYMLLVMGEGVEWESVTELTTILCGTVHHHVGLDITMWGTKWEDMDVFTTIHCLPFVLPEEL